MTCILKNTISIWQTPHRFGRWMRMKKKADYEKQIQAILLNSNKPSQFYALCNDMVNSYGVSLEIGDFCTLSAFFNQLSFVTD